MTNKSFLPVVSMWCLNLSQYFISIISNILLVLVNCGGVVFFSGTPWSPRCLVCTCCRLEWLNRSCGWSVGQSCAPLPCCASSMCFLTAATSTSSISSSAKYTPRTRYLSLPLSCLFYYSLWECKKKKKHFTIHLHSF